MRRSSAVTVGESPREPKSYMPTSSINVSKRWIVRAIGKRSAVFISRSAFIAAVCGSGMASVKEAEEMR